MKATARIHSRPLQTVAIESLEARRLFTAGPSLIAAAIQSTPGVVDLQAQFVRSPARPVHVGKSPADASARLRISNVGDTTAKGSLAALVYLSNDSTLDSGDTLIGHAAAPRAVIKAGKSKTLNAQLVFPSGTTTGNYHLIAVVDPAGVIPGNVGAGNASLAPTTITLALGHPHDHQPDDGGGETIDDGPTGDDTSIDDGGGGTDSSTSSSTQPTTSSSGDGSDFGDSGEDSGGGDDGGGDDGGGADF